MNSIDILTNKVQNFDTSNYNFDQRQSMLKKLTINIPNANDSRNTEHRVSNSLPISRAGSR
jgi:hypothetical protein